MLNIEYTHETIQKLAEAIHESLHIDLSTPMTLEKLTKAIIDFGVDIEYVNITDANNPLFVMSAEYEKRGCRDYVIKINKNKNEKVLLFRVAAEFGKIILYELPEDIEKHREEKTMKVRELLKSLQSRTEIHITTNLYTGDEFICKNPQQAIINHGHETVKNWFVMDNTIYINLEE